MAKQNKIKNIDITKSGPMTYRDLQEINLTQYNISPTFLKFSDLIGASFAPISLYDARELTELNVSSPLGTSTTPWGESMFDESTATEEQFLNLGDIRAKNLPWYAKLSAGVAKGAVLAGTTFLDGTLGLAMGTVAAIDKGDASLLWDNPFSRLMLQINEESEKFMPNYYTKAELESPWYENILSANFIGDKLIKNLGFTVGAFYSGNVFSNLLKATKIPLLIGILSKSVQAPKHIISGTGAVLSAINEGRIEALNNSSDWFKYQKQQLDDIYTQKFQALEDAYSGLDDSNSVASYNTLKKQLQDDYNKSLAKINEDRTKMGNADLLMNLPILTASNIILFGKLYGNGFKTARKTNGIYGKVGELKTTATEHMNRKAILKGLGRAFSEGAEEIEQKAASVIAGKAYELDLNNYYAALSDPNTVDETINWGKAFGLGLLETLGEGGTWEEGFIGALTGALGMPMFRGIRNAEGKLLSPITIEGGIRGAFQELKALARRELEIVDYVNSRAKDPKFLNLWKHYVRHKFYDKKMDEAVENNDEFDYKNNEDSLLINDIEMFDNAGKLDDLKALVLSGVDLSDEDIQLLIDDTSTESTVNDENINNQIRYIQDEIEKLKQQKKSTINLKSRKGIDKAIKKKESLILSLLKTLLDNSGSTFYIGPFIDEKGNKKSVEEVRKKILENALTVLNNIDILTQIKDKIDVRTNELLTDDQLSTLTYLGMKSNSWKNRNTSMFNSVLSFVTNTEGLEGVKNGIDLGLALKENPNLKEALKNTINSLAENALDALIYNSIIDDIIKTSDGVLDFNRKLEEYLGNPQKITEQNQRVDEQRALELADKDRLEKENEIDNLATFGAVYRHKTDDTDENGNLQYSELYNNSSNPTVRDTDKALRFRNEVNLAIDSSDYDDLTKLYLKGLINDRFETMGDYSQLTNPNEGVGEENSGIGDIILLANEAINKNPVKQLTQVNNNNIPQVDNTATGNDLVGTTPPLMQLQQGTKDLNNLLNGLIEKGSLGDSDEFYLRLHKFNEDFILFRQILESAFKIKENNEAALSTALKELNKLKRTWLNVGASNDANQKLEGYFIQTEERIKSKLYSIDNSNSSNNIADILLDNTIEDIQAESKQGESKSYLRSDLTEFTIDSFKGGTLERFADKYPLYKDVWNKIMFDYINKGNVRVGDTIELRLEPTESNGLTYETVYMYHNGNIVGVLPKSDRTEYKGILDIYKLLKEGKLLKTTVSLVMLGKFPYTRTERRPLHKVKGVNGALNVKLGIMTRSGMVTNDELLNNNTENVFDFANAVGKVYMLLKNSRGKFSPKRVMVKRFNNQEFPLIALKDSGNPIAIRLFNLIDQSVKAIIKGIETNNMNLSFNAMDSLYTGLFKDLVLQGFHMDLMRNPLDGSTYLQFRVGDRRTRVNIAEIHDGRAVFNLNELLLFDTIVNELTLFNPVFNINVKKINNPQYNQEIIESGLLETYISDSQMVGSWFTTNYLDANGNEQAADRVKGKFNPPTLYSKKLEVTDAKGKLYTFYIDNNGKTIIYSRETNSEISWESLNPVVLELYKADLLYGNTMNGSNLINGVLLIERDGKKYALDRNKKMLLNKDFTDKFIELLNKKNNPLIEEPLFISASDDNVINPGRYTQEVFTKASALMELYKEELQRLDSIEDEDIFEEEARKVDAKLPTGFITVFNTDTNKTEIVPYEPTLYHHGNLNQTNTYNKVGDTIQVSYEGRNPILKVTKANNGKIVEAVDLEDGRIIIKDGKFLSIEEVMNLKKLGSVHTINITIETNKNGKKEANMPIPKELQGIAKKYGTLLIDDVQYPIIIIDRPNGELHNYKILLPNGKETDFGVLGFTNAPKDVSPLSILAFITNPLNMGEAVLTFKDNLTLQLSILPLQQTQKLLQLDVDLDAMADALDTNVHNVPTSNLSLTQQPETKSNTLPLNNTTLNIDLDYDNNIELLLAMAISREAWESMSDDSKQSILNCL